MAKFEERKTPSLLARASGVEEKLKRSHSIDLPAMSAAECSGKSNNAYLNEGRRVPEEVAGR